MPRFSLTAAIAEGVTHGSIVGAFTCYNLEQLAGVVRAAESTTQSVCLLLAEGAFRSALGPALCRAMVSAAEQATVPIAIQLDHTRDLELMRRALDQGVTAVMADGSTLPYPDNVRLVTDARAIAIRYGASVEAELTHIPGDEDRAVAVATTTGTDVSRAVEFVDQTGADLLAVAIGNVHGAYATPPLLDLTRLSRLRAALHLPLTLHGTSGVPDDQVRSAIVNGIQKINVNTELRRSYLDAAHETTRDELSSANLLAIGARLSAAVEATTAVHLDRCRHRQAQHD
ncbi:class II fructose-bisphosphate aldolase [Gordonia sp. SL306]|uniref:class II fructose-bisphosphate aldolase n=1 Tax=Gordonia sp. SL306 TaxID=2995145 RepID=UPI0022721170|nr:class II fructose-bisphosphate aldolase [Gordonia sp. SL306]WAC56819.1 class II fructose-bisphosphate aldolase [Gordonia sp. SL306]